MLNANVEAQTLILPLFSTPYSPTLTLAGLKLDKIQRLLSVPILIDGEFSVSLRWHYYGERF